jgi:hypothetical protein
MLFVFKNPVIDIDEFFRDVMRLFDRFDDADSKKFALPEFLQTFGNRLRRRTMPTPY